MGDAIRLDGPEGVEREYRREGTRPYRERIPVAREIPEVDASPP